MRWGAVALAAFALTTAYAQRPAAVFVNAPSPQLVAGDSFKVNASAYDSTGAVMKSAVIAWSSSDKSAVTLDPDGTAHAVAPGWADVFADSSGTRGTVRIQVVPLAINVKPANRTIYVGESVSYTADVLDINGQPLSGVPIQWRVFGANSGTNNGAQIDSRGNLFTSGFGTYFVEAYYTYTVGAGPFIPRFFGNTLLTVRIPNSFSSTKLLDSTAIRQSFQLRQRRGAISVNDSGQISYTGSLEGFASAALVWQNGAFRPLAVASTPAELPGSVLLDIDEPALNNNGEIATRGVIIPSRTALLFGGSDGAAHMLLFDGSSGAGVTNIRNFLTTRFSLNDSGTTLFRADYQEIGSTVFKTGLFSVSANGAIHIVVPAATPLDGIGTTYSFDRDYGLANDGSVLFFVTNGSARALYRVAPDTSIARVVGTGDVINGSPVTSLGNVAVGKNGQFATAVFAGVWNALLYNGAARSQVTLSGYRNIYAVSGAGEALVYGDGGAGTGLYRWIGGSVKPAVLLGTPAPDGDLYTQFDSGGITARGDVIAQARTANDLLVVVNVGTSAAAKAATVFRTGATVNASAGPAFYNFVLNGHMGNPMVKTGSYVPMVYEIATNSAVPRLIGGDLLPGGWFYEGNQDVRRNADGDLIVSTDQSLNRVRGSSSILLAHFPQRSQAGQINAPFQVAGNSSGAAVTVGGTSFAVQQLSTVQAGVANMIAYLGTSATYRTASPGGGFFLSSNDIAVDESGRVYANLRVTGGPDGLFLYAGGSWSTIVKVGDVYDARAVTSIGTVRVAGNSCFAIINTQGGLSHLARYTDGAWTDLINFGDAVPTGGTVSFIGSFDANRNGAVAAIVNGTGGVQYVVYADGISSRVAGDSDQAMSGGEYLWPLFQVSINDDNRIFLTALNQDDVLVLYEFDPLF